MSHAGGAADSGGGCACGGLGDRKSLNPPLNFAVNLKLKKSNTVFLRKERVGGNVKI